MPIVVSSTEDLETILSDLKDRLNKTVTADDAELGQMIDAAVAYYARMIGPLTGTVTQTFDGGRTSLILDARAAAITSAAYSDGTAIDVADLTLDTSTGILHWGYNTAGLFSYGARNVTVTYTITLPADHRETIIADVAGYFAATQRGGGQGPSFSSEGYELPYQQNPMMLFPRITALAAQYPSIA